MNNPNPFVPQTTLLDQKNKKRARFQVAILTILGCNIFLVCIVLLFQGCKRDGASTAEGTDATHPNTDLAMENSNGIAALPPITTNLAGITPPPNGPVVTPPTPQPSTGLVPPMDNLGHSSEYVVVKGDTMAKIADNNHVSLAALKAANPGVIETKMQIGAKLQIPPPKAATTSTAGNMAGASTGSGDTYTVKSGDTLTKIAKDHGTSIQAIQALNNLRSTQIQAGKTLRLPPRTSAAMNSTEAPMTPPAPGTSSPVPSSTSLR